jgi:hypothetical protein
MKIRDKGLDADSLRLLQQEGGSQSTATKRKSLFDGDGETLDTRGVTTTLGIGTELNPEVIAQERRAKVDAIKAKYQAGLYKMPSSREVAEKLVEEIELEILDGARTTPVS